MIDEHGRNIRCLRLSVTDLCPLRCIYCMPEKGVEKIDHGQIMTVEECVELCRACAELRQAIARAIRAKPVSHAMVETGRSDSRRGMSGTGG